MNWLRLAAPCAALALGACASINTHIDYDRQADLDSYETFAWKETPDTSLAESHPLIHRRIVDRIVADIQEGGRLQLVEQDPDLYVTYHTKSREEMQLNTTSLGYGYGPGWYWDPYWTRRGMGMRSSTTTVTTYTRGTLIIDVWDAAKDQLVWRGAVERVVSEDPTKATKQINQALDKLGDDWERQISRGR
jgi:hypothetical protein